MASLIASRSNLISEVEHASSGICNETYLAIALQESIAPSYKSKKGSK